tara:strand:- start:707 stop:1336 length:630 start_codon:yes stop_codon:yes gene_type:complete
MPSVVEETDHGLGNFSILEYAETGQDICPVNAREWEFSNPALLSIHPLPILPSHKPQPLSQRRNRSRQIADLMHGRNLDQVPLLFRVQCPNLPCGQFLAELADGGQVAGDFGVGHEGNMFHLLQNVKHVKLTIDFRANPDKFPNMSPAKYITVKEAATILGKSEPSVRRYMSEGKLGRYERFGVVVLRESEVKKFVAPVIGRPPIEDKS